MKSRKTERQRITSLDTAYQTDETDEADEYAYRSRKDFTGGF